MEAQEKRILFQHKVVQKRVGSITDRTYFVGAQCGA